ncbi:uncharacterized protein TNCV_4066421 [Trichonephila clavipes]|uniref:Mutator-like transposase domain-containing protein n=1 Tax=Trichonephila clavipes TaxID=2585209 RepID=A0A8X7BHC5_TRICX|nr:uncharacterized protein TNCV_4066421 [Trichonephila clavipes]
MRNAKCRVSAKRKRQFRGNGSTIKHSKNSSATSTNASSSKIKIPAVFDEEIAEYQRKTLTGNREIDMEVQFKFVFTTLLPKMFRRSSKKTLNCPELNTRFVYVLHPTKNKIVECGISVDGTWQRRGYSSMNGCFAALSVDTGLKYAYYYGDGDSKGFISVKDTYGKDSVTKSECIGHVQKRVGARLRKLKSKNKNLSGKGKLTDSFIDRLQNYYGIAVHSNVGNLSGLQQNVIAALFHCSSSVEKPMHGQCPIGKESWCYYQRALSSGKKPKEKYKGLSNELLNMIKPTYLELCTKELLTKCLHGKTQNSNECLNGVIWHSVPKEFFVCFKTFKSGALDVVIQFNDGYKGCVEIFKKLNITPGYFTLKSCKHLDINRINDAERHSTPNVKQRRKILRATREKKSMF